MPTSEWQLAETLDAPNWGAIERRYPWLSSLADTPQDPHHHAEGDVLTHTRMVVEALLALPAWQTLSHTERSVLFLAALMHDIAKPICTEVDEKGKIVSPKHALKGEGISRTELWRSASDYADIPFLQREQVCKLVRHHGLPLWFYEKDDPDRALAAASHVVRLDLLALLAEADVRGRISPDRERLLDRIDYFRSYAQELDCYSKPRAFASEHARFRYFQKYDADLSYEAYDDTRCRVVMLSGLPASGKDTWIAQHAGDLPVISLDAIRTELKIEPGESTGTVVREGRERARLYLQKGQSFIWNATNINLQIRRSLISFFSDYRARAEIVVLATPYASVLERNRARRDPVPEKIIRYMLQHYELPDCTEAHRVEYRSAEGVYDSLVVPS
jgi:predicted kinase